MRQKILPSPMSIPEVMGDPCASGIREHAEALVDALNHAERLIGRYPQVERSIAQLAEALTEHAAAVMEQLTEAAGLPAEGESISKTSSPYGDYRRDRSSGCWIWMRSVNPAGNPVCGRKTAGRHNVAARIYWMLAHGGIDDGDLVVRTCGMRLCVNPEHGEIVDRREHAARTAGASLLSWDAVRHIRTTLSDGVEDVGATMKAFAAQYAVTDDTIRSIVRNKVWCDASYQPGFTVRCAGDKCTETFRTTSLIRKYHSRDCRAATLRAHDDAQEWTPRRVRDSRTLAAEFASAELEWQERVPREKGSSVWAVASVDQPIGDGTGTLRDLLPDVGADDPVVALERSIQTRVLSGLSEEAVQAMSRPELEALRARLLAEGVVD